MMAGDRASGDSSAGAAVQREDEGVAASDQAVQRQEGPGEEKEEEEAPM